jgi:ribosome-associated protein
MILTHGRRTTIATKPLAPRVSAPHLERLIVKSLDTHKAEDIVSVDLTGKSDFADSMIIASGTSSRHVGSLADRVVEALKAIGLSPIPVEGENACDWVLVDAGDVVVHIFRPEARRYYNLEKMWSVAMPSEFEAAH